MDNDDLTITSYMEELYRLTGGDIECLVSMYDVGATIGLDKNAAGSLAEQLMVQGLAELKTLSGGITITIEGLSSLGVSVSTPSADAGTGYLQLGKETIITDSDRQTIQLLTEEVKSVVREHKIDYSLLEEIVIDLKTIEVQLLSPHPKTRIFTELFRSLQSVLSSAKADDIAAKLGAAMN